MASLLVAAVGTPPVASPQFCSDVHEYMVVNGSVPVPSQVIKPRHSAHLPRRSASFKPATDCAPACGAGTTCCQDPASPPPGTCYAVSNCAQLPGPGESIESAWAPW